MPSTHFLIRLYRVIRIVIHVAVGISIAASAFPFCSPNRKLTLTRWWCAKLLKHFNLTVIARGHLPTVATHSTLFVANHISWADIHAINSVMPVRFVAKMEIKDWPVFGYLVKKSGTLFINRAHRKDAARIVEVVTASLGDGDNLCFFPEGTTTDGTEVLPFKSSIMQAAINANAHIVPIAIRYPNPDGSTNTSAAYAGDTSLLESMSTLLKHPHPTVELEFFAPIAPLSRSRQDVANQAFQIIHAHLHGKSG